MATAPKTTRLSDDVTKPQPTAPGDAPADTYDPKERASSAAPDKAQAAEDGYQSVNAVVKTGDIPVVTPSGNRTESYSAVGPDGEAVVLVHNFDTGKTAVPKTWAATTAYALGDYIIRTSKVLEATTAGTSGASAPTAPGSVGGTVTDGTVVWTRRT
jgi:hypothetical protein